MFEFPKLPYELDALEPVLSRKAVDLHYNKHHRKYYDNLAKLITGTRFEDLPLVGIVREATNPVVFNNAAQVYNHDVWWNSLSPTPTKPSEGLLQEIDHLFGSFENFKDQLIERGAKHFGSGWIWLVRAEDEVELWTTHDGDTPITTDKVSPLFTIDLWEHAFYVDYPADKKTYLEQVFDIINWNYASKNLEETM